MSTRRWNCARLLVAAALAGAAGAGAQPKPFTLERVMSAPFPTDLVAARAGGKIAWVFDARGARNVWVAEPPDYKARAVTAYTDDDGQDLGELQWTPDARAIAQAALATESLPRVGRRTSDRASFCRRSKPSDRCVQRQTPIAARSFSPSCSRTGVHHGWLPDERKN